MANKISYEEWLNSFSSILQDKADMRSSELRNYIGDGSAFRSYYEEGSTPMQAVNDEMESWSVD